jgi:CRISPR/Cas system-associated endoribonuclease Cas2
MATLEKLKEHVKKSQTALTEEVKKAEDASKSQEVRKLKKKVKRLSRKAGKMVFFEKMAERRKTKKKDRKSEDS